VENKLTTELYRAAVLTFEDLSLMLPTPGVEDWQRSATHTDAIRIAFSGPFGGSLALCVYGDLLPRIAANMLGQAEPPTRAEQLDALGEVANVICGNMLPGIGGSDALFEISTPQMVPINEIMKSASDAQVNVQLGLEEGYVDLFLWLKSG
jgi:CheY-specific phosphatase CheX